MRARTRKRSPESRPGYETVHIGTWTDKKLSMESAPADYHYKGLDRLPAIPQNRPMRKLYLALILLLLNTGEINAQNKEESRKPPTYVFGVSNVAFTAVDSLLNVEAEANRGFYITKVCVTPGSATAAAYTLWQLIRTTTASSGGTVIAAEVTSGNNVNAKMDQRNATWTGIVRTGGTEGSSGAILDSDMIFVNITATPPAVIDEFCREYCNENEKCPFVPKGVTNGVTLMFTGTAGGASQAGRIEIIATSNE